MSPDLGNGLFESIGAWFTWRNAWQLHKDKKLHGVYWPTTFFFTSWGIWNIYYYAAIDQPISWTAGVVLVLGNIVWCVQALKYKDRKDPEPTTHTSYSTNDQHE